MWFQCSALDPASGAAGASIVCQNQGPFLDLPSGELTVCNWKWPFIVDFPIKHGDFPLLCSFTRGYTDDFHVLPLLIGLFGLNPWLNDLKNPNELQETQQYYMFSMRLKNIKISRSRKKMLSILSYLQVMWVCGRKNWPWDRICGQSGRNVGRSFGTGHQGSPKYQACIMFLRKGAHLIILIFEPLKGELSN